MEDIWDRGERGREWVLDLSGDSRRCTGSWGRVNTHGGQTLPGHSETRGPRVSSSQVPAWCPRFPTLNSYQAQAGPAVSFLKQVPLSILGRKEGGGQRFFLSLVV